MTKNQRHLIVSSSGRTVSSFTNVRCHNSSNDDDEDDEDDDGGDGYEVSISDETQCAVETIVSQHHSANNFSPVRQLYNIYIYFILFYILFYLFIICFILILFFNY